MQSLGSELQSTVYRMANHGASSLANAITWLNSIKPLSAFTSSAYNFGDYQYPCCATIYHIQYIKTIVSAPPHEFYCGNNPGEDPTDFDDFSESMYVTSPTSKICHLLYRSSFSIDNNCYEVLQISDGALDSEHPQAEDLDKDEGDRNTSVQSITVL